MRPDMIPGAVLPDYALPDHTDTVRKLSEIQGSDPMVVTLARGHYCPKEHQQHLELAAHQPQFGVAYTQIVTISTDDHHTSQEFRDSVGAHWPFLSDPGRTIQKDLDIQEYTDPQHDPMIPQVWEAGEYSSFHGWDRRSPEEIAAALAGARVPV
jgi:peroxiredoxin